MNQIKHTLKPSEKTLKSKSPNLQQIKHTQNHKTTEKTILKPKKKKKIKMGGQKKGKHKNIPQILIGASSSSKLGC